MSPAMASRAVGTAPPSIAAPTAASLANSRTGQLPVFSTPESVQLLPAAKLAELLQEVSPGEKLDLNVEQFIQEHADQFVDSVTDFACRLAKHRKSPTLDARDIQLHLEKNWDIRVPGYGDDPRPTRRTAPTPVHQARLQAIARSQNGLI